MTERMNMGRLQLPEEQDRSSFDPEKDITQRDLSKIADQYGRECYDGLWDRALGTAKDLRILAPRHRSLQFYQSFDDLIAEKRSAEDWGNFTYLAVDMKIAFPEHALTLSDTDAEKLEEYWKYNGHYLNSPVENKLIWARQKKILFGESKQTAFTAEELAEADKIMDGAREHEHPLALAGFLVRRKLSLPEGHGVVLESDWEKLHAELRKSTLSVGQFAELAANMKILAAEEVKITDKGLELIMAVSNLNEKTPLMPDTIEL